jgi:hypothetical protein
MAWRLETVKKNRDIFCSLAFKNPLNCPHRHAALTQTLQAVSPQTLPQPIRVPLPLKCVFRCVSQPRGILLKTVWSQFVPHFSRPIDSLTRMLSGFAFSSGLYR